MDRQHVEVLAIGAGPANLALADRRRGDGAGAVGQHADRGAARRRRLAARDAAAVDAEPGLLSQGPGDVAQSAQRIHLRELPHSVGRLDEFVNLGSSTPYRLEISNYLRWVAHSLTPGPRSRTAGRCESSPRSGRARRPITGWLVTDRRRLADRLLATSSSAPGGTPTSPSSSRDPARRGSSTAPSSAAGSPSIDPDADRTGWS